MIVTADEVARALRGALDLANRRTQSLAAFDLSEAGFWRSFGAVFLTLPVFVVALALARYRLGQLGPELPLIDLSPLTLIVAAGLLACFVLPALAAVVVLRRLSLGHRYVPFVVVTNWIAVMALALLSVPAVLHIVGWAPSGLAKLYAAAFAVIAVRMYFCAAKAALNAPAPVVGGVVAVVVVLNLVIVGTVDALAA